VIILNCDIGERGVGHPVDVELMRYIDMANIACGGHSGDEKSAKAFLKMARDRNIQVSCHLSYPDVANFGRKTVVLSRPELFRSLDAQYALLPDVKTVKLHGALYNDANVNSELSGNLVEWMQTAGIKEVVTLPDSELAAEAVKKGLKVIGEGYAERNYAYNPQKKQLTLVNRSKAYASITDVDEALKHALGIINGNKVSAFVESPEGGTGNIDVPLTVETICVHSDSQIVLELVKRLKKVLETL
jgi:UPF0271 protein